MVQFSTEQRVFICCNFLKHESAGLCRRAFRERFPEIDPPTRSTVHKIVNKFKRTGSVLDQKKNRKRHVLTEEKLDDIGARLERSPRKSLTKLARQAGVSYGSVHKATELLKLRSYKSKQNISIIFEKPVFETVKVEMDQEDDDYIPEVTLRPVKAEPLPETEQHEISHQPDKPVPVKVEPNSEETEMDKVADTEVNGTSVKVEPNSDDDSVDESYFSEEMQLLKSNVKTEMEAVDEI